MSKLEIDHEIIKEITNNLSSNEKLSSKPMENYVKNGSVSVIHNADQSETNINEKLDKVDTLIENTSSLINDVDKSFVEYDIHLKKEIKK